MEASTTAILAFNLLCTGNLTASGFGIDDTPKPYSSEYRIDIESGQWCESECKTIFAIASVQTTQITLEETSKISPTGGEESLKNFVNRETGEHRVFSLSGRKYQRFSITWKGQCERKPFTGFPKFETKF